MEARFTSVTCVITVSSSLKRAAARKSISVRSPQTRDPRLQQDILFDAACAQEFGAGPFHKLEIIGVVDDASGIRVFVVDTHRKLRDFPIKICDPFDSQMGAIVAPGLNRETGGDRKPSLFLWRTAAPTFPKTGLPDIAEKRTRVAACERRDKRGSVALTDGGTPRRKGKERWVMPDLLHNLWQTLAARASRGQ